MHLVVKDVDGERYTTAEVSEQQLDDLIYNIRDGAVVALVDTDGGSHIFVVANVISFQVVR